MLGFGFFQPPLGAQDLGEVVAAGQGIGVVRAEHPGPGLQDRAVLGFGFFQPPPVLQNVGEVVAAGQGIGVLGAEHTASGLKNNAVLGLGFFQPPLGAQDAGDVGEAAEGGYSPGGTGRLDQGLQKCPVLGFGFF